jgi:hypothetical protein
LNRDETLGGLTAATLFLIVALLIPLAVALLWGDVTADAAYAHFQTARLIAQGQWEGFPQLYPLGLVPAAWGGLALPTVAAGLSVLGWAIAIAGWFATGHALDRRAFSFAIAALLALHPLQGQVLGSETGLVLGLTAVLVWVVVKMQRLRAFPTIASGLGLLALAAIYPPALAFILPVIACRLIRRRSVPSLAPVALGAACYLLISLLTEAWHTPRSAALLIGAVQVLTAAGFASLLPRAESLFPTSPSRHVLGQALVTAGLVALIVWQAVALTKDWRLRPVDRLALYRETAAWLARNTLPDETIAAEHPSLIGYLADRRTMSLPDNASAQSLLAEIDRQRPDACISLNTMAWQGVRAQPWFQERYEQVYETATPYDAAAPVTVFLHRPSPFDEGEFVNANVIFVSQAGEQIELIGYAVEHWRLTPGEPLHVTLHWRAATTLSEPLLLTLRLFDPASGDVWAHIEDAFPGGLPTDLWNADEAMVARYGLHVPPDLPAGDYVLDVTLLRATGSALTAQGEASPSYALANVVRPPVADDAPPSPDHAVNIAFGDAIALVGYDAPERIAPGDPLRVALYWHALEAVSLNYKVFVHFLGSDGLLIAQDDSEPVRWTYPTTRWRPGEFIRDEHTLEIDASIPPGDYAIEVGLYDPETGDRLSVRIAGEGPSANRAILREVRVR